MLVEEERPSLHEHPAHRRRARSAVEPQDHRSARPVGARALSEPVEEVGAVGGGGGVEVAGPHRCRRPSEPWESTDRIARRRAARRSERQSQHGQASAD